MKACGLFNLAILGFITNWTDLDEVFSGYWGVGRKSNVGIYVTHMGGSNIYMCASPCVIS